MSNMCFIKANDFWDKCEDPIFTIITPIYNRRSTIERTMQSVENQTFRDIEYILIDDGSSENSDDLVNEFMEKSKLPILYIKKCNGGVHTARNKGYEYGRGLFVICIDSDDELLPNACTIFWDAWNTIPNDQRKEYWQLKALCEDVNGNIVSDLFPDNINFMTKEEANFYFSNSKGEQLGCRLLSIMKDNKFPEPYEVKFVNEIVVWKKMEKQYKSFGINKSVRVYHTEGNDRLCGVSKKTIQSVKNAYWNSCYALNNKDHLIIGKNHYLKTLFRLCIMEKILMQEDSHFLEQYQLDYRKDKINRRLMMLPATLGAYVYRTMRMQKIKHIEV